MSLVKADCRVRASGVPANQAPSRMRFIRQQYRKNGEHFFGPGGSPCPHTFYERVSG
jgi:hypothetical protein